jgi:hypothetical protein
VLGYLNLGIPYFYYEPDGGWDIGKNPVDLRQPATTHLDSSWGRQAFLMMMRLGWSDGGCEEGPDQFREVIQHGEEFLRNHGHSEVSDSIRLELGNAYATWWNLSLDTLNIPGTKPEKYKAGANEAELRAVALYREYLQGQKTDVPDIQTRLRTLQENPAGSKQYDYFCDDPGD